MSEKEKHTGVLIVLVGPSGVGKSTISRKLAESLHVWYTVSVTTREKQPSMPKPPAKAMPTSKPAPAPRTMR